MNKNEFEALDQIKAQPRATLPGALTDKSPRTLLYGYTCNRHTWHVYLDPKGILHRVVYDHNNLLLGHLEGGIEDRALVPDKRLYPEDCDLEACTALLRAGCNLPFTSYTEGKSRTGAYVGATMEDLVPSVNLDVPYLLEMVRNPSYVPPGLDRLNPGQLKALQDIVKAACSEDRDKEARARLGLLLSASAREADIRHTSYAEVPGYRVPAGMCVAGTELSKLVDAAQALCSSVATVDLNLYSDAVQVRNEASEDAINGYFGWNGYAVILSVKDVITAGRIALVMLKDLPLQNVAEELRTAERVEMGEAGMAYLLTDKDSAGAHHVFFEKNGIINAIAFNVFGEPLRVSKDSFTQGPLSILKA